MALCLGAATLWSIPILAAGLLALLRYSFGSLFVVGESVAATLLHSTGADIAGTVQRLQNHPWEGIFRSALGVGLSAAAAITRPPAALLLVAGALAWSVALGFVLPAVLLATALGIGTIALVAPKPLT